MNGALKDAALDVLAKLVSSFPLDSFYESISIDIRDQLESQFIHAFEATMTRARLYSIQQDIEEERLSFLNLEDV